MAKIEPSRTPGLALAKSPPPSREVSRSTVGSAAGGGCIVPGCPVLPCLVQAVFKVFRSLDRRGR